jgi:hypothetical protein
MTPPRASWASRSSPSSRSASGSHWPSTGARCSNRTGRPASQALTLHRPKEHPMTDIVWLAIGAALALAIFIYVLVLRKG